MMGFLGILTLIPSTQRLRAVRAFTSAAKLTLTPVSRFVLLPSSVFQLIEDQLFAIRERLFSFTASVSSQVSIWSLHYTEMVGSCLSLSYSPRKLFAKFSLRNCTCLTTGRWTQWLQS
jgi:hypothetical protein